MAICCDRNKAERQPAELHVYALAFFPPTTCLMTSNTVNDGSQSLKRKRQDELPWCLVESEPGITPLTLFFFDTDFLYMLVSSWHSHFHRDGTHVWCNKYSCGRSVRPWHVDRVCILSAVWVRVLWTWRVYCSGNIYGLIFAHPYEDDLPAPVQSDQDKKDASNVFFSCQASLYDNMNNTFSKCFRLAIDCHQHMCNIGFTGHLIQYWWTSRHWRTSILSKNGSWTCWSSRKFYKCYI